MKSLFPVSTLLDLYTAQSQSLYITDFRKSYRLPHGVDRSALVVSIDASQAPLWVTAHTIIISLLFMAACELTVLTVLTFFEVGDSGTRRAMLVAYYNAGTPARAVYLMYGYLRKSLFRCTKAADDGRIISAIDRSAARASFLLLFIAFSLLSGDLIVKFFLGGTKLVESYAAQANPSAIFYPNLEINDTTGANTVNVKVFEAVKGLRSAAVYQAIARKTSGADNLRSRIAFTEEIIPDSTLLPDGTRQNGTGARFTYQYNITGYEMGLRDAPSLVFAVKGSCATFHGTNSVRYLNNTLFDPTGQQWDYDSYPFYGDRTWSSVVVLEREMYTAPWAQLEIQFNDTVLQQNELYGGWTFQLIPHTAWRISRSTKSGDPWYETEPNPRAPNPILPTDLYNGEYRVKRGRPPLRCTQNDTYTYNGKTVNHVNKLGQLRGLKLSKFIREDVFGREFGAPVFSPILGYVPFAALASTTHFIPNQRRLDAQRANISTDLHGLVAMSFVYSREVVRNTALLYPSLNGIDATFANLAAVNGSVPANYADFFLESPQVAALSVFVLFTTIAVTIFLWLLVFIWNKVFNANTKLDNTSLTGRLNLRMHALLAPNLYRTLDEALSRGKHKWAGRNTITPFIRDPDDLRDQRIDSSMAVKSSTVVSQEKAGSLQQMAQSFPTSDPDTIANCESEFAEPKLVKATGNLESEPLPLFQQFWNWIKDDKTRMVQKKYEVEMTRSWNSELQETPWGDVRGIP